MFFSLFLCIFPTCFSLSLSSHSQLQMLHDPDDIVKIPRAEYVQWCRERLDQFHYNATPFMSPSSSNSAADSTMNTNNRSPTGSRFGYALPHEILLEVFGYHKESQSTLYAVSLVCRQWMLCVTPLLYRHVRIWDTYRWATFILTLTRDKRSYNYGKLVSTLNLANDNVGALYGKLGSRVIQRSGSCYWS